MPNITKKNDWIFAVSISNLFFIYSWSNFTLPNGLSLIDAPHFEKALFSIFGAITLLTCAIRFFLKLARHTKSPHLITLAQLVSLAILYFPFMVIRAKFDMAVRVPWLFSIAWWKQCLGAPLLFTLVGALAFSIPLLIWLRPRSISKSAQTMAWVLSSFCFVTFSQLMVVGSAYLLMSTREPGLETAQRQPIKIVTLLFDELSERYLQKYLEDLPHFKKFRESAVIATEAIAPATSTMYSIPALLTGKIPTEKRDTGFLQDRYQIQNVWINESQSIFEKAHEKGLRTGLVGWYLPYCRIFGRDLDHCTTLARTNYDFSGPFYQCMGELFQQAFRDPINTHLSRYERVLSRARKVVSSPKYNFVFVHVPVPHHPKIYDSKADKLVLAQDYSEFGYLENLKLADAFLGQMLNAMHESGVLSYADILVTSDHSVHYRWRGWKEEQGDDRSAFMVHLSDQVKGATFSNRFNTILYPDLIDELMHRRLTQPSEVISWLRSNGRAIASIESGIQHE